jgi:UDP-N-acetylglucosamine 2-epimerase
MTNSAPVHSFVGTKAQFIKMTPTLRELDVRKLSYKLVLTGLYEKTIEETNNDLRSNLGIQQPNRVLYLGKDIADVLQIATHLT